MKNPGTGFFASAILIFSMSSSAASVDMRWDPGAEDCRTNDQKHLQSHYFDDSTVVLRQNPCIDYEANLLFLLIGQTRAMLVDTGAVDDPQIANLTTTAVEEILKLKGLKLPLVVVHTHGHQDHRAGDAAFAALPDVEIAPIESESLRKFFGFADWPNGLAQIDLGGRVIDLIPTPGHHEDHIVFYDRNTQLLLTGDFLLPGRLLVQDIDAYQASARRVADFVKTHPVSYVLGAHIELDAKGRPFPSGATFHPDERPLALSQADVFALPAALAEFNGFYSTHPNFIVVNPIHDLIALATGVIAAIVLLVWLTRRLLKRRRASRIAA